MVFNCSYIPFVIVFTREFLLVLPRLLAFLETDEMFGVLMKLDIFYLFRSNIHEISYISWKPRRLTSIRSQITTCALVSPGSYCSEFSV